MEYCEGLRRVVEVMRSERNISYELTRLIFSASATYLNPSVSHYRSLLGRSVVRVYGKYTRGDAIRWEHVPELTWLIFSASATNLAPSSPMLPPPRPSVVSVYGKYKKWWDQMSASVWTHSVHFQRLGQISCSFRTDFVIIEMECCEGLPRMIETLKSDGSTCMNAPDWLPAHETYMSHLHHRYCCFVDQVWWESTENTRDDEIRWRQVPDLTLLIFRASATHVAPRPLILLYWRWSVVRVYKKHQRWWD